MRKYRLFIAGAIVISALALSLGSWASIQGSDNSDDNIDPGGVQTFTFSKQFQNLESADMANLDLANDAGQTLYFTPQDNMRNTTVLFLYNTSNTYKVSSLYTFRLDGSLWLDYTFGLPSGEMWRICGDLVDTNIETWQGYAYVPFGNSSAHAMLVLPHGVKVEGYIAWNGGTTYDPHDAVPTLPIRFSN